jgi:hypothetical protein
MTEKLTLTFRNTFSSSETVLVTCAQESTPIWRTISKSCCNKKIQLRSCSFEISCAIRVTAITRLALRFLLADEMNIVMKDKQYVFLQKWLRRKWSQTLKKSVTYREKPVSKKMWKYDRHLFLRFFSSEPWIFSSRAGCFPQLNVQYP